jgi:hypothetical protein
VWLSLVAPAGAEPRGGYEQMFKPMRELLAPCIDVADRCKAEGKGESVCRAEAGQCVKELEERMKEEEIRNLEKEDPGIRSTMTAIDAHQACVSNILDCLKEKKHISLCIERAPRCQADTGERAAGACCPSRCIDAYQGRVKQGDEALRAFADIFINHPSCFPGLPAMTSP